LNSEKTAISRRGPSAPLKKLLELNLIEGTVLDYGGGKGADFLHLKDKFPTIHWDPNFQYQNGLFIPQKNEFNLTHKFDTILCTYVLNVLPPEERSMAIQNVLKLLKGKAIFTLRSDKIRGTPYEDGVLTSKKTFQKSFTAEQLQQLIPNSKIILDTGTFVSVITP
jgi:ATP adenylyltransferase